MTVASDILNGVGLWVTRKERKEEKDDDAIRSVLSAVNKTKLYLASRDRGEPIDRDAEANLVELWQSASVHVRKTDPDLAYRLQEKAEYWANPENWSVDEIISNGIQIDKIADEAKKLLSDA